MVIMKATVHKTIEYILQAGCSTG